LYEFTIFDDRYITNLPPKMINYLPAKMTLRIALSIFPAIILINPEAT